MQQPQTAPPPAAEMIRLMLHTEDGMVPFLTPDLLEKYFPPSTLWCLGIAVNETCITPLYSTTHTNSKTSKKKATKKLKKRTIDDLHNDGGNEVTESTNNDQIQNDDDGHTTTKTVTTNTKKPCGYTFSSTGGLFHLDSWICPYTRIVVPAFHNQSNNKSITVGTTPSVSIHEGSSTIRLWTSNGRQTITTSQYMDCAMNGIRATVILPLYPLEDEEVPSALVAATRTEKDDGDCQRTRNLLATQKLIISQQMEAFQNIKDAQSSESLQLQTPTQLCVPFIVSDRYCYFIEQSKFPVNNDDDFNVRDAEYDKLLVREASTRTHLQNMIQEVQQDDSFSSNNGRNEKRNSTIIMMIGWHTIANINHRWHLLQSLHSSLSRFSQPLTLGTISTCSTQQLLQQINYTTLGHTNDDDKCFNGNSILIGTNLPACWAKMKRCVVVEVTIPDVKTESGTSSASVPTLDADGCYDFNIPAIVQDHAFFSDSRPLMKNCTCITCTTYSRAYLYHLVCAKEMLAEMLFFIHNFHHLLHLLRVVNEHHANHDIESIKRLTLSIQSQLRTSSEK